MRFQNGENNWILGIFKFPWCPPGTLPIPNACVATGIPRLGCSSVGGTWTEPSTTEESCLSNEGCYEVNTLNAYR